MTLRHYIYSVALLLLSTFAKVQGEASYQCFHLDPEIIGFTQPLLLNDKGLLAGVLQDNDGISSRGIILHPANKSFFVSETSPQSLSAVHFNNQSALIIQNNTTAYLWHPEDPFEELCLPNASQNTLFACNNLGQYLIVKKPHDAPKGPLEIKELAVWDKENGFTSIDLDETFSKYQFLPCAINDQGLVLLAAFNLSSGSYESGFILYDIRSKLLIRSFIPSTGDQFFLPTSLNNNGDLTGTLYFSDNCSLSAAGMVWMHDGTQHIIDLTDKSYNLTFSAINDDGEVIGQKSGIANENLYAIKWSLSSGVSNLDQEIEQELDNPIQIIDAKALNQRGDILAIAKENEQLFQVLLIK